MIPTPGVGVQVLSRHIRMCAFDGTQVTGLFSVTYNIVILSVCNLFKLDRSVFSRC